MKIDMTAALCHTDHSDRAYLWDSELDGGERRNARGESREQRRQRHDEARAICGMCSQREVCLVVGVTDRHATGIYGGELVEQIRRTNGRQRSAVGAGL